MSLMIRLSAWEFLGHKFRDSAGKRLIFGMLMEMLISDNISKNLELIGVNSAIKFLHGRVL